MIYSSHTFITSHFRAAEQERKVVARMNYLAEYNERMRLERAARSHEKQSRIKQRVQAAAEMELRRKISMVRQWRINEKKRLLRIKMDKEAKTKRKEDDVIIYVLLVVPRGFTRALMNNGDDDGDEK